LNLESKIPTTWAKTKWSHARTHTHTHTHKIFSSIKKDLIFETPFKLLYEAFATKLQNTILPSFKNLPKCQTSKKTLAKKSPSHLVEKKHINRNKCQSQSLCLQLKRKWVHLPLMNDKQSWKVFALIFNTDKLTHIAKKKLNYPKKKTQTQTNYTPSKLCKSIHKCTPKLQT